MDNFFFPRNIKIKNKYKNEIEFNLNFNKLTNLALSIFEWDLPTSCDSWMLEYALIFWGKACLALSNKYGYVSLPCAYSNMFNLYGYSNSIIAYGFNGYSQNMTAYMPGAENYDAQAVVCIDNSARSRLGDYIISGSYKMTDTLRAIDVATQKIKNPYWITCDDRQYQTVKKCLSDVYSNENAIITGSNLRGDSLNIIQTGSASGILKDLWDDYNNYFDVVKENLGINNNAQADKRERLIVDEINANNVVNDLLLTDRINQREQFCENVKKVFNLDINFKVNKKILKVYTEEGINVEEMEENQLA